MYEIYLLHNLAYSTFTRHMNVLKLPDFLPVSERLIHTNSAVICIAFVFNVDFHHGIGKILILPRFVLAVKIVVKSLSADFQCLTIKAYFTGNSAVISADCDIFQSLLFPDF